MKIQILFISVISLLLYSCKDSVKNIHPFKQGYTTIIHSKTTIKSSQASINTSENLQMLFDDDKNTKFLVAAAKNTITIHNKTASIIKKYSITSANDAPGRDPKNWTLSGSIDGLTWNIIDNKTNETFSKRGITNTYNLANNNAKYSHYRIVLEQSHTSVYGDNYLQIAEIAFIALTKHPVTDFTTSTNRIKIMDAIYFKDISANAPNTWKWIFENGTPSESSLQNPTVVYKTPGNHPVMLITKNNYGVDTLRVEREIKVYDPENPWAGFYYPSIHLTPTDTLSEGYKRVLKVIPDLKSTINEITLGVCKQLYKNISEVPDFNSINFTFNWSDVLAAKGGNQTSMELWFSTKYIHHALKDKPDAAVKHEIYGVLWHELTHGYQFSPSTINDQYKRGTDYFAFLEGAADLVRINAGLHASRHPDLGIDNHKYLSGYTTTGFFLKWVVDNYDKDFLYKFNATAKTMKPWSYKAAFKYILQKDVDDLWESYKDYVKTYRQENNIQQKKKIDWTHS